MGLPAVRFRRVPGIARSALFDMCFVAAVMLTVLGALFSFSGEETSTAQAFPILLFNLGLIAVLGAYLGYRVWTALYQPTGGQSAPQLHRRFLLIFSLAALTPAIIVGAFSTSLISRNINELFGDDVRKNMNSARVILDDYIDQELAELGRAVRTVKSDLNRRPDICLLYTSPSPRDKRQSRMPSSA